MADDAGTHYEIRLTGRQALGAVLGFLLALAVAFFLGVAAGLSHRPVSPSPSPQAGGAEASKPARTLTRHGPASRAPAKAAPEATAWAGAREPGAPPAVPEVREGFGDLPPEEARAAVASAKPETKEASRAASAAAPRKGAEKYFVQIMSTSSRAEAEKMASRLRQRRYPVAISTVSGEKGAVFRVRVGPYGSKQDASRMAARLSSEEKLSVWVAPEEK